jgi:hypothetical protein
VTDGEAKIKDNMNKQRNQNYNIDAVIISYNTDTDRCLLTIFVKSKWIYAVVRAIRGSGVR